MFAFGPLRSAAMMTSKRTTLIQRRNECIKEIWAKKELCDFIIRSGDSEFHVHKLILASCSRYFRALFQFNNNEGGCKESHTSDVSSPIMAAILEYCYSAQIELDDDNIQDILLAASYLQMDTLVELCEEYFKLNIGASNCLGIMVLADRCNLSDLYQKAFSFCLDRFQEIIREQEFHELEESWLIKIISDDRLHMTDEEKVFEAVIDWIKADEEKRSSSLKNLAEFIRFPQISAFNLIKLKSHELIKDSPECCKRIEEAKDYLLLRGHPEQEAIISAPAQSFRPRLSQRLSQRIFAAGGWTNEYRPTETVEKYDPYLDIWVEVSPMNRPRCGVGLTVLNGHPYAIGGHDGQGYLKSAERYDIQEDVWLDDLPAMRMERTSVGVVSLNGFIYAIGGQVGSESLDIVERYDPRANVWTLCKSMKERRLGAGVAVLGAYIYVVGGADKSGVLKTAERYDPADNSWNHISSMTSKRKHLGCTAYNNRIFAVGGRDGGSELDSAECYNPETDSWELIPKMSAKRSGVGLVELENLIYVIGGQSGGDRLKLVEAYDPEAQRWMVKKPMNQERLGAGVAVYSPLAIS